MKIFLLLLLFGFVVFILLKIFIAYEKKVNRVIDFFNLKIWKYKKLQNLKFEARTDGKKINSWDKQHKIDYIINENHNEIIRTLKLYNEYFSWWETNIGEIIKQTKHCANDIANKMIFFSDTFIKRTNNEIKELQEKNDIKSIIYELETYTLHSSTSRYNSKTGLWWEIKPKEITFLTIMSPDDVLLRVEILSKYNFEMTEYQYNCENQRSLMTPELRRTIIERDKGICQICGKKCDNKEIEIDHIKPVSKGGKTTVSNLQVLCVSCNRSKSNKWLSEINIKEIKNVENKDISIGKKIADWGMIEKRYNTIKDNKINVNNAIKIGDIVTIEYVEDNYIIKVKLVEKSVPGLSGTVSIESPIGRAIYGLEVGNEINVVTPSGTEKIRIKKVEK